MSHSVLAWHHVWWSDEVNASPGLHHACRHALTHGAAKLPYPRDRVHAEANAAPSPSTARAVPASGR